MKLTQQELSEVLDTAIARQGMAEKRREETLGLASVDDALEIARQLNVPEEHVLAAVQELQRRKGREHRRQAIRARRKRSTMVTFGSVAAVTVVIALLAILSGGTMARLLSALPLILVFWIGLAIYAYRALCLPVTDAQLDAEEPPPAPGTCRVCGAPASTPRATFCEEHRYKGPGAVNSGA